MEYEIGEFSKMTRIPLKTLRFFKEEGLLVPSTDSNQRILYDENQVMLARQIVTMEEMGIPPGDIRRVIDGADMNDVIEKRKKKLLQDASAIRSKIDEIDSIMEEFNGVGHSAPELRHVPGCLVCYTRRHLKTLSEVRDVIIDFNAKCKEINPDVKRSDPTYDFLVVMNEEHLVWDIDVVYAVAVESVGKETADIKFTTVSEGDMLCVVHKGPYSRVGNTFASAIQWMITHGYRDAGRVREVFIKNSWNYNTVAYVEMEIQIPVKHL